MGDEIPQDFIAPEIWPECQFAHQAFADLNADRQSGFGVGPIPWTAIDAYAWRHGISDPDEFDAFARMIRVMDQVFVTHHAAAPSPGAR